MEAAYHLTQQDFVESIVTHRDRTPLRKWGLRGVVYAILLLGAAGVVFFVSRPAPQVLSNFAPLWIVAGLWAGILWGSPRIAARKQFAGQPSVQGQRTMLMDDSGLHWRWDGGSADCEWKTFLRWQESRNLFLLYYSPVSIHMVPKRSMNSEQVNEFREMLTKKIPHK